MHKIEKKTNKDGSHRLSLNIPNSAIELINLHLTNKVDIDTEIKTLTTFRRDIAKPYKLSQLTI